MTEQKNKVGRVYREEPQIYSELPIVGKISVGEKDDKGIPVSRDYFVSKGKYAELFKSVYGVKPATLLIVFISDELTKSCFEEWDARDKEGKRAAYGDGLTYYLFDEGKKEYVSETDIKKVEAYSKSKNLKWNVILHLYFVLPKIPGLYGLWKFTTKAAKSSIISIRSTFDKIQDNVGTVVNIPFELTVEKVKSQKPGSKSVFPVVNLVPHISGENIQYIASLLKSGSDVFKELGMVSDEKLNKYKQLSGYTPDALQLTAKSDDKTTEKKEIAPEVISSINEPENEANEVLEQNTETMDSKHKEIIIKAGDDEELVGAITDLFLSETLKELSEKKLKYKKYNKFDCFLDAVLLRQKELSGTPNTLFS